MIRDSFYTRIIVWINLVLFLSVFNPSAWSDQSKKITYQNLNVDQKIDVKDTDSRIKEAYQTVKSDFWVQSQGVVIKILKDDIDGGRHQRFLLRLFNDHTVLIAHNIDLAGRVGNLKLGDTVAFYGEYVWNNKGGVIHWTHHDPSGRKIGGWLMHRGKRYQ